MFFSFLGFSLIFRIASGYVVCPYCDPNHVAYPNLEETCRGYDVPMGNPNPGEKDSGQRLIIWKTLTLLFAFLEFADQRTGKNRG